MPTTKEREVLSFRVDPCQRREIEKIAADWTVARGRPCSLTAVVREALRLIIAREARKR